MQMQLQQLHMKTSASVPSLRQRQVFRRPHLSAFFLYPHDTAPHGLAPSLVAIPPTLWGGRSTRTQRSQRFLLGAHAPSAETVSCTELSFRMPDFFRAFTSTSSSSSHASSPPSPTLIAKGATVRGALDLGDGDLHVAGALCGPVCTTSTVHVADEATVEGRIEAAHVAIRGSVAADVRVTDTLTLYPDGSLRGRVLLIDGATLDIRMGALYNGTTLQGDASAQLPARTERRGDGLADEMPVVDWYALDGASGEAPGEASPTEESTEGSTTEEPTTEDAPEAAQDNVPNSPPEETQDEAAASAPPPPDNTTDSSPNQGAPDAPPSPSRDQDDTPEDSATDAFGMEW